jgi:hypothetical protein
VLSEKGQKSMPVSLRKHLYIAIYLLVALVLLWPLLQGGFVFALDMVFTPTPPPITWTASTAPFYVILTGLYAILPAVVIQKFLLVAIFLLAGAGAHRLVDKLLPAAYKSVAAFGCYFAGLLYMFNPFVYSRFMSGQFLVLLGYALLPFFAASLLMFLREPTWRRSVYVALWWVALSALSLHFAGFALLLALALAAPYIWQKRRDRKWLAATSAKSLAGLGVALAASSYWLLAAVLGYGGAADVISSFGVADRTAFATNGTGFGLLGNVLALQGFWGDAKNLYLTPQDLFSWWWLPLCAIWGLVLLGIYKSWRAQKAITIAFGSLILVSAILAIGTAGTAAAPINEWLAAHVPFFSGYREPQKFTALIAIAYTYFGAMAIAALALMLQRIDARKRLAAIALPLLALPVLAAPLMPGSFYGQLEPHDYPADWYAVNSYLRATAPDAKVLFLPWHLYMRFGFANRVIANPADRFFANPIIISNDPEMNGAKSTLPSADQQTVQTKVLTAGLQGSQIAPDLKMLKIRYILVAKELDYRLYDYINNQPDVTLIRETQTLKLYKVNDTTQPSHASN